MHSGIHLGKKAERLTLKFLSEDFLNFRKFEINSEKLNQRDCKEIEMKDCPEQISFLMEGEAQKCLDPPVWR